MALMSPLDVALLAGEIGSRTLHVGVLMVFTPPPGGPDTLVADAYRDALAAVRAPNALMLRPVRSAATGGLPVWQRDDRLDMSRHLRRHALPAPGTDTDLFALVARLHDQPLDRSQPMWEAHLIEGLAGGRFAFYGKIHHATLDGMSGIRLLEQSCTTDPDRRGMPLLAPEEPPHPAPGRRCLPNPLHVAREGVAAATGAAELAGRAALGGLDWLGRAVTKESTVLPMRAPRTALDGHVGSDRVFVGRSWPLSRLRAVQRATGATEGDVVLAMCGGALRGYLVRHGALPSSSLVGLVPIAQRRREEATGGNAFGLALCSLGTDLDDPAERLHRIRHSSADAKRRIRGLGAGALALALPALAPNLARILPLRVGEVLPPSYNVVVSTVPGPTRPLYWNGAALEHMYPLSIVFDGTGLNITVCRYADRMDFGFLAHPESMPDLERYTNEAEIALGDLERIPEVRSS